MSMYSGKADCADTVEIHGGAEDFIKTNDVYLGDSIVPLRITTVKDIVPFYPHLISVGGWSDGRGSIHLTTRSFVDMEEEERLKWYQDYAVKYIKKCKRKKITPTLEDFINSFGRLFSTDKAIRTIYERVSNGDMSLDGIYLPIHEYYRKNLYEEMLRVGWDKDRARLWCYGFRKEYPDESEI